MKRRKKDEVPTEPPSDTNGNMPEGEIPTPQQMSARSEVPLALPVDEKRKPVISWRLHSDRTTSIEVACWLNIHHTQTGEEYEQLSFTVQRSYKAASKN